jgi:hypothetical protein
MRFIQQQDTPNNKKDWGLHNNDLLRIKFVDNYEMYSKSQSNILYTFVWF